MSRLTSIVYKPQQAGPTPGRYTRVPLEAAQLVAGYGIEGDRKGGSGERQLNIMAAETLAALHREGFQTEPGELGEQLIMEGLDIDGLPAGTRLQIGEAACVELGIPRTGCNRFEDYQGKSPQLAAGRMGRMAKVIASGPIRTGDPVAALE